MIVKIDKLSHEMRGIAKIDNKVNCDIEMQVVDRKNIEKRIITCRKKYNVDYALQANEVIEKSKIHVN